MRKRDNQSGGISRRRLLQGAAGAGAVALGGYHIAAAAEKVALSAIYMQRAQVVLPEATRDLRYTRNRIRHEAAFHDWRQRLEVHE